ncbi:MAG: AAA family ATPase [Deltaproteobacteria bacterium]|nr:AAA family ATPase [Deltaproteobacteria bacterium]
MEQSSVLQAMRNPGFYPEATRKVELRETHISTLFLTDRFVYKVKKPVDFGFLDYTTLNARRFFCEQELRLNRRLANDVYLQILPVRRQGDRITLTGEEGEVIEYVLKMRRLPADRMLDTLLMEGSVDREMIRRIALHLIGFHSRAESTPEISIYGSPRRIRKNIEENFEQTRSFIGETIEKNVFERIRNDSRAFLDGNRSLLEKRVTEKKIRDCHGDLRPEHICVQEPIVIFDCVEFNRRFRYSDVACDLAFLAMDLDFFEQPELSRHLVHNYARYTRDIDLLRLIRFYKSYRAYVRGKVESMKAKDPALPAGEKERTRRAARRYFALAGTYTGARPYLIITCGLTGTGKSTLALRLAQDLDLPLFRSDLVRKELAGIPASAHQDVPFGEGIYGEAMSRWTYDALLERGEEELRKGNPVLLDAAFLKKEERKKAGKLAQKMNARFFVIETRCPEETAMQRIRKRHQERDDPSDGREEIYHAQKERFDPVTGLPDGPHIVVSTADRGDPALRVEMEILLAVET